MKQALTGTRIKVIANSNSHNYQVGGVYRVHDVDDDGTFRATDDDGRVGDYLKWMDCEPVGLGWDWLRTQLDGETLDLLTAFEGVEHLTLRSDVEAMLISAIPHLDSAIREVLPVLENSADSALMQGEDEEEEEEEQASLPNL
jgi:hypothetical protein